MNISNGNSKIKIGIIDGPVDLDHPAFHKSTIRTAKESQYGACKKASSTSCRHGTFVTGMLTGRRGPNELAICPNCEIILYPLFRDDEYLENNTISFPSSTPGELSAAIIEIIDAGAKIINLSLGLDSSSLIDYLELKEAYAYAIQNNAVIVIAAGNQANAGYNSLLNHSWIIPVAACDGHSRLSTLSNYGPSIASRGLMAPGENITSTSPGGNHTLMSGTSAAAPFVTGTMALLWSIFPKATAAHLIHAVRKSYIPRRHTIMPLLLDAELAWKNLKSIK